MARRGKRAAAALPPAEDPGGGQATKAQTATTKKQKIRTVDERALDAVDSWFDHMLAHELWMPESAALRSVCQEDEHAGVVSPLLKSWFDVTNFSDEIAAATWTMPPVSTASSDDSAATDAKPPPNAMKKIRLHPSTEQRAKLEHMFCTSRAVFNKLVASSRDECAPHYSEKRDKNVVATLAELGAKYHRICQAGKLYKFFRNPKSRRWHKQVYEEVRASGFRDFMKAVRSSRALYAALKAKGKKTAYPELTFKSKFKLSDTIELRARSVTYTATKKGETRVRFHPLFFGFTEPTDGIAIRKPLPELEYSVRLQRLREGEFYLVVPQRLAWRPVDSGRCCAIDPGVCNFVTVYDPSGRTVSVTDTSAVIKKRFDSIDAMKSELSKFENERYQEPRSESAIVSSRRRRYRLRRRIHYTNRRVTRMISDMHHKVASWLAANYRCVLLPTFQTSQMVRKYEQESAADGTPASSAVDGATSEAGEPDDTVGTQEAPPTRYRKRKVRSSTARSMMSQRHYRFKMLLKYKMDRVGGVLVECGEEYTSKTCSACGELNVSLGGSREFRCEVCRGHFDRDVNAARNIYMKNWQLLQ